MYFTHFVRKRASSRTTDSAGSAEGAESVESVVESVGSQILLKTLTPHDRFSFHPLEQPLYRSPPLGLSAINSKSSTVLDSSTRPAAPPAVRRIEPTLLLVAGDLSPP